MTTLLTAVGRHFCLMKILNKVPVILLISRNKNLLVLQNSNAADILIGLLRLRKCSPDTFRPELKGGVSIVRELHVYPYLNIN